MRKIGLLRIATAVLLLAGFYTGAAAAELKVLCANEMRPALQELGPAFEKSSGNKLSIQYDAAGKVEEKIAADQPFDVAILTKPQVDKLVGVAKLVGGSTATLASKGADQVFVAASANFSDQTVLAKALIDFLAAPAAKQVYKAKGLEPAERPAS